MVNEKNSIRTLMKETLSSIPKPIFEVYSQQIANRLYLEEEWITANTIGITVSRFPEVDTNPIIHKAWELEKRVAVPKCNPKEKQIIFRILRDFSQLESGYNGLLEPIEDLTEEIGPNGIDLLITPGLAFTHQGHRLGFGGGYYDRYLMKHHGKFLALAFNEQIITEIPVETYDIPVPKIITVDKVIERI